MYTSDVWRALFSVPRLEDALKPLLTVLCRELGVHTVVVRRIDLAACEVTTVAGESLRPQWRFHTRKPFANEWVSELVAFARAGAVRFGAAASDELLALLVGGSDGQVAAIPLQGNEGEPTWALVLAGAAETLADNVSGEITRLVEPFRAALAATHRLQELTRLREVVEADNRALLTKLARQDVLGTIVGADSGFRQVMTRVAQVASTDAPVLLQGETGTGKEVAAREIHRQSPRSKGPMLRVNCGAIPPGLVDSELFGHERGSFTGATQRREGWFERADGGTLFLDELGELPLAAQVRLLRVLQEGVVVRVGGERAVTVDVRVVAATHADLGEMVASGRFRQDLWYRVSVFPIWLPPLRERREDIPELAAHFAWHVGKRLGGQPLTLADSDIALLVAYDWPGNIRELAAVIERAGILGNGKHLEVPGALGPARAPTESTIPQPVAKTRDAAPLPSLDDAVRQHIERALAHTDGKIEGPAGAAELLAVNPHTLRSRMRKLGVRWQRFRK